MAIEDELLSNPIFSGIERDYIQKVISENETLNLNAGDYLLHQGEESDELFILLRGKIDIVIEKENKIDTKIAQLKPGSIIGEVAILLASPRTASGIAVEDSILCKINKAYINAQINRGEINAFRFIYNLAKDMAYRMKLVAERIETLVDEKGTVTKEINKYKEKLLKDILL